MEVWALARNDHMHMVQKHLAEGQTTLCDIEKKGYYFWKRSSFSFSLLTASSKVSLFHETVSRKGPIEEVCLFSNATNEISPGPLIADFPAAGSIRRRGQQNREKLSSLS